MDNVVHMVMDPMVINFPSNTLVKRKSRSIRADGMLKLLVTCIWLGIWVLAGGYQGLFLHPEPGLGSKMGEPKAPLVLTVYGLPESPHHISINHSQLLWPLKMLLGNQFPSMSFEGKPVQWKNLWFDTNKQVSFFMPSPSLFVLFENDIILTYPLMSKTERLIITMDDEKWQRTLIDVLKEDPNCFDVLASFQESPIKWNGFFYPLSTKASFFRKYPVVEFVELDSLWLRCPNGHLLALENDPKNWSKPVIVLFDQQIDSKKYSYYGISGTIADYAIESNRRLFFTQTKAGEFRNHPELKLINRGTIPIRDERNYPATLRVLPLEFPADLKFTISALLGRIINDPLLETKVFYEDNELNLNGAITSFENILLEEGPPLVITHVISLPQDSLTSNQIKILGDYQTTAIAIAKSIASSVDDTDFLSDEKLLELERLSKSENLTLDVKIREHDLQNLVKCRTMHPNCPASVLHYIRYAWSHRYLDNNCFSFLGTPSLTGKTQLGFVLDCFSKFPRQDGIVIEWDNPLQSFRLSCVLHFKFDDNNEKMTQDIYYALPFSRDLLDALKNDIKNIEDFLGLKDGIPRDSAADIFSNLNISFGSRFKFKSLGLLQAIILSRVSAKIRPCGPMSIPSFRRFIDSTFKDPVVIILDEFNIHSVPDYLYTALILARNLFRSSCLVVLAMGTNVNASNIVDHTNMSNNSRDSGNVDCWVNMLVSTPPPTVLSLASALGNLSLFKTKQERLYDWLFRTKKVYSLDGVLKSSKIPGMFSLLVQNVLSVFKSDHGIESGELLHAALLKTAVDLKTRKSTIYRTKEGIRGQLWMHFSHYRALSAQGFSSKLIDRHFAFLQSVEKGNIATSFQLGRDPTKDKSLHHFWPEKELLNFPHRDRADVISVESYKPSSYFNDVAEDEASYLVLMSSPPDMPPPGLDYIYDRNSSIFSSKKTLMDDIERNMGNMHKDAFWTFRMLSELSISSVIVTSVNKTVRIGEYLEMLGQGALVRASVRGGLSGQNVLNFLSKLLQELCLFPIHDLTGADSVETTLGNIGNCIVPFVGPLNHIFSPEFRNIPGVFSGSISNVKNRGQIDGIIYPFNNEEVSRAFSSEDHFDDWPNIFEPILSHRMDNNDEATKEQNEESGFKSEPAAKETGLHLGDAGKKKLKVKIDPEMEERMAKRLKADLKDWKELPENYQKRKIEFKTNLIVTFEMKNHSAPFSWPELEACCLRAHNFNLKYISAGYQHLHLILTAKWDEKKILVEIGRLARQEKKSDDSKDKAKLTMVMSGQVMEFSAVNPGLEMDRISVAAKSKHTENAIMSMPKDSVLDMPESSNIGILAETQAPAFPDADAKKSGQTSGQAAPSAQQAGSTGETGPTWKTFSYSMRILKATFDMNSRVYNLEPIIDSVEENLITVIVIPIENLFGHSLA